MFGRLRQAYFARFAFQDGTGSSRPVERNIEMKTHANAVGHGFKEGL